MDIEEIVAFAESLPGAIPSFPFDEETLVEKVGGKIFLLISLDAQPVRYAVKLSPERNLVLREAWWQIEGAYHMNKTHWSSFITEGLPKALICEMITESYGLVFKKLPKKVRAEIESNYGAAK